MIIEIICILVFYLLCMIFALYYFNLFQTKDEFSKEELKNVLPFIRQFFNSINVSYSMSIVLLVIVITSFIGCLLLLLVENWIINSALLPAALFFLLPYVKSNFEETQVTLSDNYADTLSSILVRYGNVICIGFSAGAATSLMYNWAFYKLFHFLWFLPNIIVISFFVIISMKKAIE